MAKPIIVSWARFDWMCAQLVCRIQNDACFVSLKNIYGIPRGGLVVAVKLSHTLKLPIILDVAQINQHTLLVDDIADSGITLQNLLSSHTPSLVATLYRQVGCVVKPNYYIADKKQTWVLFPWESLCDCKLDKIEYEQKTKLKKMNQNS